MKRIDQLTFTRFLALLLVLAYHGGGGVYMRLFDFFPFSPLLRSAPTAVSYLYVLSGFVMSLVYHRPQERFDVSGYWRARFVRIYPLYIISFLLICLYYLNEVARIKPLKILANIFVLQAWYPPYALSFNYASWSMTVEFFFYAVFPFFTMWAYRQSTRKLIWLSMGLWVVSQTVHYFLWWFHYPEWRNFIVYNPIFHLNSFILGAVGAIWFLREGTTHAVNRRLNLSLFAGSVMLAALLVILGGVFPQFPHALQPMAGLFAPVLTLVIITLSLDTSRLSAVLNHPWLINLGETAYALYILHVPVLWFGRRITQSLDVSDPHLVMKWAFLPIMLAIGLLAHFYVDIPLRKWLKNLLKRISMPLLVLDLAIIAVSIYLSFRLRFGEGRPLLEYRQTAYLMFWLAFVLRTVFSVSTNALDPANLFAAPGRFARPAVVSVCAGSFVLAALMFGAFSLGWIPGYPRSVFLMDWGFVLGLSLFVRYVFRIAGLRSMNSAEA